MKAGSDGLACRLPGILPALRPERPPLVSGIAPCSSSARRPVHRPNQFDLLRERRFAPFFWTQFLGAANDNVYKNALVIFVAFQAATLTAMSANDLVNLA